MSLRSIIENTRHTEWGKNLKIKYQSLNKCIADLPKPSHPGLELFCVTCNFSPFVAGGYFGLFFLEEELKHVNALAILRLLVELLTSQKFFKLAEKLQSVTCPP